MFLLAYLQVNTQPAAPAEFSPEAKTLQSFSRLFTRQSSPRRRSVRSLRSRLVSPPSRRSRDCGPAVSLLPMGSRWGWGGGGGGKRQGRGRRTILGGGEVGGGEQGGRGGVGGEWHASCSSSSADRSKGNFTVLKERLRMASWDLA